jgi:hypothetical protein
MESDFACVASEVKGFPVPSQAVVDRRTAIPTQENHISPLIGSQIMSAFLRPFEQFGEERVARLS